MPTVTLEPAAADLDYVERLLAEADLPTADLRDGHAEFFVGTDAGQRVGCGGVEAHGDAGLLRSVVIEPALRGAGYGEALCAALEARARADGIESLYLLTTTAAEFFAAQGYERVDRSAAPATIRETSQFAELCPDSAVCLRKTLGDGGPD